MSTTSEASERGTRALTARYVVALSTIAVLSVAGQVFVQAMLDTQEHDSRTINLAGRQRMLGQRLVKNALVYASGQERAERAREIEGLLAEWKEVQLGLRAGDAERGLTGDTSARVRQAFRDLEPSFQAMGSALDDLIHERVAANAAVARLLAHEDGFLRGMDEIVTLYEQESYERVRTMQWVESGLMALVLVTLLIEGFFVFRPAVGRIRRILARLARSESEKAAILSAVPDALLRVDRDGIVRAAYVPPVGAARAEDLVGRPLSTVVDARDASVWQGHLERTIEDQEASHFEYQDGMSGDEGGARHMEARMVPCPEHEALVILRDISERRRLERELLVVAEREQRRIGMDLHDGLCQHLAGLAIMTRTLANQVGQGKVEDPRVIQPELESVAHYLQEGLAMARQIARGLFPQVLLEQGLVAALERACAMVQALHKDVSCTCELDIESAPIEDAVAAQIYRIAQEAIGNAIRHGKARAVTLRAWLERGQLVLEITDDGVGLPPGTTPEASRGMGLRSMTTRARTIGARLAFSDREPRGTVISCRVPIHDDGE